MKLVTVFLTILMSFSAFSAENVCSQEEGLQKTDQLIANINQIHAQLSAAATLQYTLELNEFGQQFGSQVGKLEQKERLLQNAHIRYVIECDFKNPGFRSQLRKSIDDRVEYLKAIFNKQ